MRQLVIGDIHGGYKALLQVLERCEYNPQEDQLIFLGDYVDGWSESYKVIEEIIRLDKESKIGNIHILGNHDKWFMQWIETDVHSWTHGALATAESYAEAADFPLSKERFWSRTVDGYMIECYALNLSPVVVPTHHRKFFNSLHNYYFDEVNKRIFVHGGFNRHLSIKEQKVSDIYYWDRDLLMQAMSSKATMDSKQPVSMRFKDDVDEVFVGHTTTLSWETDQPIFADKVIAIDTGGGFSGRLTIMDVDTKEYWQSDKVKDLYSNEKGRD